MCLARTVKAVRQYPPHHQVAAKFHEALHENFSDCLSAIDGVTIDVNLDYLSCGDEIIYHSDSLNDNLASLLHRDGIRSLRFDCGIENDEISRFVDILANAGRENEHAVDIVNEFWEADLQHVQCEVVDDLEYSEIEDTEQLKNKILESSTDSSSGSGSIDPRVWSADEAEETKRTQQHEEAARLTFGGIVRHSPADLDAIERLVGEDRKCDTKQDVIDLLLQLCAYEKSIQDLTLLLEALQSAYDRLIRNGRFSTLTEILSGIKRLLSERRFESDRFERRLTEFHQRCGDMVRIKMITKRLNDYPETNLKPVIEYFRHLGWESLNNMIWMLGELDHYPARRVLCDLLVEKGRDQIQLIGGAIFDSRWYVARNVAMIIGEAGVGDGVAYLQRAAKHPDERVRIEAARAFARIDSDEVLRELLKLLDDESERVRATAVNCVAHLKNPNAFSRLREIVTADDFVDREPTSMRQLLEALVKSGSKESLEVLVELLKKSSFFKRAKVRKMQEAVISSLGSSDSPVAVRILEAIAAATDSHLANSARKVLARMKAPKKKTLRFSSAGGGVS